MSFVTYALMPSVPEEGSRQPTIRSAGKQGISFPSKSGMRGGGPWDLMAKDRLSNSVFSIFGGADDLPQVRTPRRPEAPGQDAALPSMRASADLPPHSTGGVDVSNHTPLSETFLRADGSFDAANRTNQASGRSCHIAPADPSWAPYVIPAALVVIVSVGMAFIASVPA